MVYGICLGTSLVVSFVRVQAVIGLILLDHVLARIKEALNEANIAFVLDILRYLLTVHSLTNEW